MRSLTLCVLLLAACSNNTKSQQVQVTHQARYTYGQAVQITEGQYKGCTGTIGAVKTQDDDSTYKYDVTDLVCSDANRTEHTVSDIPESQIGSK